MRLVDADEAIPTLEGLTEQVQTEGATLVKALVFAALKSRSVIPTVDAVPVVHGRWENGHCSSCGEDIAGVLDTWTNVQNFLYCPNCGAKMDGGDADDHG